MLYLPCDWRVQILQSMDCDLWRQVKGRDIHTQGIGHRSLVLCGLRLIVVFKLVGSSYGHSPLVSFGRRKAAPPPSPVRTQ